MTEAATSKEAARAWFRQHLVKPAKAGPYQPWDLRLEGRGWSLTPGARRGNVGRRKQRDRRPAGFVGQSRWELDPLWPILFEVLAGRVAADGQLVAGTPPLPWSEGLEPALEDLARVESTWSALKPALAALEAHEAALEASSLVAPRTVVSGVGSRPAASVRRRLALAAARKALLELAELQPTPPRPARGQRLDALARASHLALVSAFVRHPGLRCPGELFSLRPLAAVALGLERPAGRRASFDELARQWRPPAKRGAAR